jgi:hypothetical protein
LNRKLLLRVKSAEADVRFAIAFSVMKRGI